MRATTQALIDELLGKREGVVTYAELIAAGADAATASREHAARRWRRLLPGIYLATNTEPTLRQRCHAALLHAGQGGMVSGAAGCALRGLALGSEPATVLVLVPAATRRASTEFVTVVRTRRLPPSQLLRREGTADLAVASLERCVEDAVRAAVTLDDARHIACRSLKDKRVEWSEVVAAASRRGPGSGFLARVVRDLADGVRSPAEGRLHDGLLPAARRGQLPPYLLNPELYVEGQLLGSPDAYFPGLGLGDEMDSREWHGSVDQLDGTLQRHERFRAAGLHLNHTTPARFDGDPRAHLAQLGSLVEERQGLAVPEPAGLVVLARGPLLPDRSPWPQVDPSRWR